MGCDSLGFEIAETAHMLRRGYDRRAARLGITRPQWRVIARLGREPGLRQVDLADRLDMEPITLCRILDRLEDAGLVERRRDPADRRAWRLALTGKAEPLLASLRLLATELGGEAFDGFTHPEIEMLRGMLERVRENLSRPEAAPTKVSA